MTLCLFFLNGAAWAAFPGGDLKDPVLQEAWRMAGVKEYAPALNALSRYAPNPETLGEYHFVFGKVLESTGRHLEAIEHLRASYLFAPKGELKERALLDRAFLYQGMGYLYEARSAFAVFLSVFPSSGRVKEAHLGLAQSMAGIGQLSEALAHFDKAGEEPDAAFGKATVLQRLGRTQEAAAAYEAAAVRHRDYLSRSPETLYHFCENLRIRGRSSEAEGCFGRLEGSPLAERVSISLGLLAMDGGRMEDAARLFNAALSAPDRATKRRALLLLAKAELRMDRVDSAKARLEEIRERLPYGDDYDEALLLLSDIHRKEERTPLAISLLKELVFRASPKREALDRFETIIRNARGRDPSDFSKIWRSVGSWLLDASREPFLLEVVAGLPDAGAVLEICGFLSKYGSGDAKERTSLVLAAFHTERGDNGLAREYLARIRQRGASRDELLRLEAKISLSEGDAVTAAERILAMQRLERGDLDMLGRVLLSAKNRGRTISKMEKVIADLGGSSTDYTRLADALYESGRTGESIDYYRKAAELSPENRWPAYRLGLLAGEMENIPQTGKAVGAEERMGLVSSALSREREIAQKMEAMAW